MSFFILQTSRLNDFTLQQEEVDSIHTVSIEDLQGLFRGEVDKIYCRDNKITEITLSDFVPHETSYFQAVAKFLSLAKNGSM